MTSVLVCDDSPLAREALRRAVATVPGVERVTTAANGEEVLRRWGADRSDLILMDVRMPGLGGVETVRRLLSADPGARIIRNLAGWYEAGTTPGETGTAIVAGHVDNADGPAVFYRLGALKRGDRVEVDRRDGTVALFTVDAVEVYSARDFPDDKVYGAAPRPELRVITCGGGYSKTTGYQGNVVVFAHLTGSRQPGGGARSRTAPRAPQPTACRAPSTCFSPHTPSGASASFSRSPTSVSEYSTRGGVSA